MSAENAAGNQFENVSGSVENGSPAANASGAVENASPAANASGAVENASPAANASGAVENAAPAANESGSAESPVQGENELAQQLNQTVPATNGNVATAPPVTENNTPAPAAAPAPPVSTSGYVMSAKAKDLQERRKGLFKEMQAEYAKVFGDDKKAPKAKMYHAAGLLTIRERDGEDAYQAKLQEYIQANQGKYTTKTRKVNNTAAAPESATRSPIVASPASAAESGKTIIRSIESMASKVKEMVDTMVSTTRTLVKSDKPDMAAIAERVVRFANEAPSTTAKKPRKTRSNKGKTHKRRSPANE